MEMVNFELIRAHAEKLKEDKEPAILPAWNVTKRKIAERRTRVVKNKTFRNEQQEYDPLLYELAVLAHGMSHAQ